MFYLLGGPPRVGKSIISREIRQKYALSVTSTDSLAVALQNVFSPEAAPDLFVFDTFNAIPADERVKLMNANPAALIDYVRRESHLVWKAAEAFIRREHDEGRDGLLEGVAVLPELVGPMEGIPHQVVFIGNQGQNHAQNIKKFAQDNQHDWMRAMSDEYIGAFALFVRRMSVYIEQEAKNFGFKYIEMDQKPFEDITRDVIKSLELKT